MDNVRKRYFGTVSRGVRAPIIKEGDDVASIVASCVLEASESENIPIREKDIIAVTESVVGRAFGNYATIDQIASDIREKFPDGSAAILFPILSRNRFSLCLKGIASGLKHLTIMLSYPSDEVGNHLISEEKVLKAGINPYTTVLTEEEYRDILPESSQELIKDIPNNVLEELMFTGFMNPKLSDDECIKVSETLCKYLKGTRQKTVEDMMSWIKRDGLQEVLRIAFGLKFE